MPKKSLKLPQFMIWFWWSELQGGLESVKYGVAVWQFLEAKAFTAGCDLAGESWLTVLDVIWKSVLPTLDNAYWIKEKN